jgi:hypothetical protein
MASASDEKQGGDKGTAAPLPTSRLERYDFGGVPMGLLAWCLLGCCLPVPPRLMLTLRLCVSSRRRRVAVRRWQCVYNSAPDVDLTGPTTVVQQETRGKSQLARPVQLRKYLCPASRGPI